MPWKEANVMDLRTEFVNRALRGELPFAALCRLYGISTKTGYKWKRRFLAEGLPGLADRSRRPQRSPTGVGEDVLCELVRLKVRHASWGPKKIRDLYGRADPGRSLPSLSTVKRLLGKAGLVERRRRRRSAQHCGRIANPLSATAANQVWTVDFKGWWYTPAKRRVLPLTVRDAFSRYVLLAQLVADARMETVKECFVRLFSTYGLPLVLRSDNGAPFACTSAPLGLSRLSAWWVTLGISLDRIAQGHPEQNGGHERMHRDIALEVEGQVDGELAAQQAALDSWRRQYNEERPHEALAMRRPAQVYGKSERRFDPQPVELQYPLTYLRRRVKRTGCIKVANRLVMLSTAVSGWHVGLQPVAAGLFNVWFGPLRLGELNVPDEKFSATS
jgi:putative transposase